MSIMKVFKFSRTHLVLQLLALVFCPGMALAQTFHTSPECWQQPRMFHAGAPTAEFANRIHIVQTAAEIEPSGAAVMSPNNAYRFWLREMSPANPESGAGVVIDVEKPQRPTLLFLGAVQTPSPRWLNEKLLYLRVMWGRIAFSDLIFDVEKSELIFHELVQDGSIAWQQFREGCQGQCPCNGSPVVEQQALPLSQAGADDIIGLLELPTIFAAGESGGVVAAASVQAAELEPIAVYSEPSLAADILASLRQPAQWAYREIGYEAGAAEVYQRMNDWYRIKIMAPERYGWVQADSSQFHELEQLLPDRLAYFNSNWNGELWKLLADQRGVGEVTQVALATGGDNTEIPIEVLEVRNIEQGLWLKVRLLSSNGCDGAALQTLNEGWVPAYSLNGALSVWYWSRGC